ncbi:hypothetical protein [Streptomyces spirodelae]|uniref:Tetratricopeptide repeat protein n=1 Tax=Streptomyces spirodelae TaxID=2812904 RepID=A0ABS3X0F5_9ACTN|nr:hypothetical protein [Streptomyces spirodelae]MBO8188869.1 hypothetical protein [Streptomyces spirodelae]
MNQAVSAGAETPQLAPTPSRFEVLIARDGSVALNGERMPTADGEEVHVAVLDAIHRAAQERGESVEATILDLRENGSATYIQVAPDGSSRLLVPTGDEAPPVDDAQPADTDPHPEGTSVQAPVPAPAPVPGPAENPAPAENPGPDAEQPQPAPAPVPGELAEAVAHINRAASGGEPQRAMVLAFRLREHAVRSYGEEHPYTLEARDLEAFVARLGGNYAKAVGIYLELARVCHRQGSPRAYGYLKRAAGNWQMLTDPQSLLAHGRGLLATWAALASEAGPAADDTVLPCHVRQRLHALAGVGGAGVAGGRGGSHDG